MTNEIKTNGTTLSADFAARLMSGIAESRAATQLTGGKHFLRFLKDGLWVYGQANDPVQENDQWAVNILTLAHGWVCWVDSAKAGEVMTSMMKPMPPCPEPIDGMPFKEQRGFELRGIGGDIDGVEVIHNLNSQGGLRAIDGLLAAIHKQLRRDPAHPCPVVVLGTDSYQNKKHGGQTYTPVYEIVAWCDMDGNIADGGEPAATPAPAPAPIPAPIPAPAPTAAAPAPVTALRPGKQAPQRTQPFPFDEQDAAPPPQPVATAQLHTGQRRRPAIQR
jgi:hypothetical protein